MKKKIFIFGHTGYIGSYLLKNLNNEEFETYGRKIPRPDNVNLYDFYYQFINDFFNENNNIFCLINSAGNIDCKTKEDYFLWLKLSKILEIYGINKKLLYWRKTENSLSSNTLQKFYDAFIVYNQTENKNFLIIFFYVFRLSLNYVLKKIKQKIF